MSENDDERKKQSEEKGEEDSGSGKFTLNTLFQGIGGLIDLVSRMDEEAKDEEHGTREFTSPSGRVKGVFGFSVKTGIGEGLTTEHSVNEDHTIRRKANEPEKQPPTDVFDEQEYVRVLIELPGLEEKDIHVEANGDILSFWTEKEQQKNAKEVILPHEVDESTLNTKYKNGVLEIRISKKQHD